MQTPTTDDPIAAGRRALARADWEQARACFQAALERDAGPEAYEGLSWAGWWLDDAELTIEMRERAYRGFRAAGDVERAAEMAAWLGSDHLEFRGDDAIGNGWLVRARRMLDGRPPSAAHGWLALLESEQAMYARADPLEAERLAREAVELGRSLGVADLEAIGLAREGATLVVRGQLEAGTRLLDEASAIASHERFVLALSPGWALCIMVAACERVGDLPRATQWCEAMHEVVARLSGRHMLGICRTSYGAVLATRGEWDRAEHELTAAVAELRVTRPGVAGVGLVRLGDLRRRQGRADEARELFERSLPHDAAILGLGQLALQEGDGASAVDAAERVLRRLDPSASVDRVPALELLARGSCAAGDHDAARRAVEELRSTVTAVGTPYLDGRVLLAGGEVAAATGDATTAKQAFEDAVDRFAIAQAPYDEARARTALAGVLRGLGRVEAAEREARRAAETLRRLGATLDLARAEALLTAPDDDDGDGEGDGAVRELSARELEVLRLVAEGCSDAEIAERLVLSPHTVHRHVANVRVKLREPSRAAAVAHAAREGLL